MIQSSSNENEKIFDDWTKDYAATDEIHDEAAYAAINESDRVSARGIEVGHIFYFGQKYAEPMKCFVAGPDGHDVAVHSGSYGIGVSRLVGGIIEASHDEHGIVWPWSVAPSEVGLINLKPGDGETDALCDKLYETLRGQGLDVLLDDRDERAGAKFSTMDLIGLPWQAVIGPRGAAAGEVEIKNRRSGEKQTLSFDAAVAALSQAP